MNYPINDIVQILQLSIAPTVLISGIGLLILSLNTRSSLIFDRIRSLIGEHSETKEAYIKDEINWLYRRVKVLRVSLYGLVISLIFNVFVIISIFIIKFFGIESGVIIPILFICAVFSIMIGLIAFLHDINLNLKALQIELKHNLK